MELGIYTFAETRADSGKGYGESAAQRLRELLEEVELADQLGLEVYGVGEHHRPDYVVSSPAVVLAAAAERTQNIRLTSAVTVLSSDDPIRVFQQFATLDLLSGGRAEIMAGRGSFIESFPLFGYDLNDYNTLFTEKLELLLKLRDAEQVTWSGKTRASINALGVYPRPVQTPLPVWVAVGGTPQSAIRAGTLGLPMALAIIGGLPEQFVPLIELYRESGRRVGHPDTHLKVSINSHLYIAENSQQASDEFFPGYAAVMSRIGRERGWPPFTRQQFEAGRTLRGALFVGSPQEIIDKIMYQYELFGHQRFLAQISVGVMEHSKIMKAIELFGTKIAPVIRQETKGK